MRPPIPPQVEEAQGKLRAAIEAGEQGPVDLSSASWPEIQRWTAALLEGTFDPQRLEHRTLALGLAGVLGEKLARAHGAFWFPHRGMLEGAAIGFPQALATVSPYGAVVAALGEVDLGRLEELERELRDALGEAAPCLGPDHYARLYDPRFVQFVAVDSAARRAMLKASPRALARRVRAALSEAKAAVPPETADQLRFQVIGALERLNSAGPLQAQAGASPRLLELLCILFAWRDATHVGPEDLWEELVPGLPLSARRMAAVNLYSLPEAGPSRAASSELGSIASALAEDFARVMASAQAAGELYARRMSEAEAMAEPELSLVRDVIQRDLERFAVPRAIAG